MAFVVFLFCLSKLNYIQPSEFEFAVRHIFYEYIRFIREIQFLYNLEPAGSHGVWGLDDYHFIPFLLGSAELEGFIFRNTDIQRYK
jgi:serine/threonine-protein phosphatase 2A activator